MGEPCADPVADIIRTNRPAGVQLLHEPHARPEAPQVFGTQLHHDGVASSAEHETEERD
jgi:hypothetical protein